jgi:hypothetical protein
MIIEYIFINFRIILEGILLSYLYPTKNDVLIKIIIGNYYILK